MQSHGPRSFDTIQRQPKAPTPLQPEVVTLAVPKTIRRKRRFSSSYFALLGLAAACTYIIVAPAIPALAWYVTRPTLPPQRILHTPPPTPALAGANATILPPETASLEAATPINRLRIPEIGIDGVINEGQDDSTLDKGIWHRPNTSSPDSGRNTVFAAHRFKYLSGSNTFFYLDKLKVHDEFTVLWGNQAYTYTIFSIETVGPTSFSIESPTTDPQVTLYTCTPLWTSKKRLVIHAKLSSQQPRNETGD
jgi:LPXTG-site transpeptidase (sortase) family protein